MSDVEKVRMRDIARELQKLPQNIYGLLWSGKLPGEQDPETGEWSVRREDLERFKKRRVAAMVNGRRKKILKTREETPA